MSTYCADKVNTDIETVKLAIEDSQESSFASSLMSSRQIMHFESDTEWFDSGVLIKLTIEFEFRRHILGVCILKRLWERENDSKGETID